MCRRASLAIKAGYTLLIFPIAAWTREYAPIPSLLALSAVHNHLIREKTRNQVALIVESGEPREVMHFALLLGYGASAVNPYLAIETLEDLYRDGAFPGRIHVGQGFQELHEGQSTRACSKLFRRWAFPRCRAIRARRFSRPSA